MCLKALYRYHEALEAFEEYLKVYGPALDEMRIKEAKKNIQELKMLLGALTVNVNVQGAAIIVGGIEVGESPLEKDIPVGPGFHTVRVEAEGYLPEERDIRVVSGKDRIIDFYLMKVPQVGFVTVEANVEGAAVIIDGEDMGAVPFEGELDVGEHAITVRKSGYRDYDVSIDLRLNQKRIVNASMVQVKKIKKCWFWTAAGITMASAAATFALGASVMSLDRKYDPYESGHEDYDRGRNLMVAADVFLGLAASGAAAALVLYFFTEWKGDTVKEKKKKISGVRLGGSGFILKF